MAYMLHSPPPSDSDFGASHPISADSTRFHQISSDFVRFRHISSDFVRLHQMSPSVGQISVVCAIIWRDKDLYLNKRRTTTTTLSMAGMESRDEVRLGDIGSG
eukprot:618994-Rhodomonas_salina.1